METTKLGLKLLGTHAIMSIVQVLLMPALFGIWQDKPIYQWLIGIIYICIFWLIVYADASYTSQNDLKRDRYFPYKGFIGGLIASIPALILYFVALIFPETQDGFNFFEVTLRVWLVPYIKIFTTFENLMPSIAIIPILLFPIGCGISYLDGPRRRKKILDAIDKSESMRTEKSKVRK